MSKASEKRLRDILRRLPESQAQMLIDFAEFLEARHGQLGAAANGLPEIATPQPIPRPEQESVVKAIKRLAATYPMLDRSKMLNETSSLMTQHVMQGRDAVEVIDELEIIFRRHYEKLTASDEAK